jgi:hypothetical protein
MTNILSRVLVNIDRLRIGESIFEHSHVTINNYNTLKIPVSIAHKIKSSMSAC